MNIDMNKFIDQINLLEDYFYDFMSSKGYSVSIYNDEEAKYLGYGGYACIDDKFALLFKLVEIPYPRSFSIFAKDRNGNNILYGDTVAIYSVSEKEDLSNEELLAKFKMALNDIYNKYKDYSKENRLDFVFNDLEMETKDYDDICIYSLKNESKKEIDCEK